MPTQLETLRMIPFFSVFPEDSDLEEFVKAGKWSKLSRGGIIYHVGDPSLVIYILIGGKVSLNRNKKSLAVLSRGEIFGEIGPLLGMDRTVNAVAMTDSLLFEFNLPSLERVKQELRYELLKHLYIVTTKRFVETTRKIICT